MKKKMVSKLIFIGLIGMLFIAGCGQDCSKVENAAVEVLAQYNVMKKDKESLQSNYDALKKECEQKVECNNINVTNRTITISDCIDVCPKSNASNCVSYINRIEILESDLEACWFNESHTDYRELYNICKDNREEDLESFNQSLEDCEDELSDCISDLTECES